MENKQHHCRCKLRKHEERLIGKIDKQDTYRHMMRTSFEYPDIPRKYESRTALYNSVGTMGFCKKEKNPEHPFKNSLNHALTKEKFAQFFKKKNIEKFEYCGMNQQSRR